MHLLDPHIHPVRQMRLCSKARRPGSGRQRLSQSPAWGPGGGVGRQGLWPPPGLWFNRCTTEGRYPTHPARAGHG